MLQSLSERNRHVPRHIRNLRVVGLRAIAMCTSYFVASQMVVVFSRSFLYSYQLRLSRHIVVPYELNYAKFEKL